MTVDPSPSPPTRIKICGVTTLEDGVLAADLGAWAVGLNFYERSPRRIPDDEAVRIGAALRRRLEVVGVFVNATPEQIARRAETVPLSIVQLHGDEGPSFCGEVARRTGARVIKAVRVRGRGDIRDLARFHTDMHLADGVGTGERAQLRGGTGTTFDWSLLADRRSSVPLVLSGGLSAGNVAAAIAAVRPYAVDVCSGVESEPGHKDEASMRALFAAAAEVTAGAATGVGPSA